MENSVITKIKNLINIRKEYVKSNFPLESRLETIVEFNKEIKLLQMIVDEHEERGDYRNSTFVTNIAEDYYKILLKCGWAPQQARSVLPNILKTEIIVTAIYREWMHIFKLRCDKAAHPQMREVMVPLRDEVAKELPEVFG